ncbi:hypothetical protein V6N12_063599 [Hibiscus sabdariffa]|uniref:pyruvate dehydrogenase (acetyl-transferring) n=1 Tax=Hibiscus sabdariffa TaxID=183260 RepID=A0ABR2FC90_9ROSI
MATGFHGVGAAVAALSSSPSNSFDSKKLLCSPRRSFPVRKGASFVVDRSDGSVNLDRNPKARRAQQLIVNAVANKADSSPASSSSKPGSPTTAISDNCGMLHYTSGGQFTIPIVIRGPGGVGRQLGAEHSQRLESYFQSIPGIQMVACSTPYNAKGLMKAAIRSENPVILFEHVLLYNLKERLPDEDYICNLEEAEMVRPGEHVTILTYSRMRYHVMQAAKTLVNKGYDPEVIDIRSLKPFDLHTIGNSVKKTHRVLIVEECMRTGGIGASLTAAITENFHDYLDAPIMCLSSQDVPTPYAGTLEEWTVVQPAQIVTAVEQLCK